MKRYEVKVTCEYYVAVVADSPGHALELAVEEEFSISDLQQFEYNITSESDDFYDYYDDTLSCGCCECCGCTCGSYGEEDYE